MHRLLLILALCATSAFAQESFDARLAKANALLKTGDAATALEQYRDLQTEDPESDVLYYSMGCAQFTEGMQAVEQKAPQDAITSFGSAKTAFEKAATSRDPEIRRRSEFNLANATAEVAKCALDAKKGEEAQKAFEEAIGRYEQILKRDPGDPGAKTNLNHLRYLLKQMLQNPPKQDPKNSEQGKQDQKQQGKQDQKQDDKQGQQGQQQDQKQDGQQGQQKDQQQKDQQASDKKDDKEKQPDEKKDEKQSAEQQKDQQKDQLASESSSSQDQEKAAKDNKDQPESRQNVEAILQSLEDSDTREQKEMRNAHGEVRLKKDWW